MIILIISIWENESGLTKVTKDKIKKDIQELIGNKWKPNKNDKLFVLYWDIKEDTSIAYT